MISLDSGPHLGGDRPRGNDKEWVLIGFWSAMADYDFDIGIMGGGAAGLTVASGAAQLGAKTLLVEREEELGGDCLHYGCVPSKTLIKTAQVYHQIKNAGRFGLPRLEVPEVDYADVVRRNGKKISAKNWVIATGSSPSIPPIKDLDKTPYVTNKEIFYLDHLPRSMIILGAGPIATEMAQAFCRLGTKVSVVQRSNQILGKEDKDLADEVLKVLSDEGVTFYLNALVVRTDDRGLEKEAVIKGVAGEINKRVAGAYFSSKIFSNKVRKGLKLFFHLKGRACG